MPDDQQLITKYLEDDDANAFEDLLKRYLQPIYNFVYRLTGSEDTQDIVQEVFIKVWKKIASYDSNYSFKSWIFTIARNTAIDWLRKKRNLVFSSLNSSDDSEFSIEDTILDTAPLPEEIFAQKENELLIRKAINSLSPSSKEVLLLHLEEDLTFEEIAKITGRPMNTAKSQYRRALAKLREILGSAPNL